MMTAVEGMYGGLSALADTLQVEQATDLCPSHNLTSPHLTSLDLTLLT